ncbi:hypothetical protein ABIA33_004196 [Streptacidiphilus sp. MAP12-16]
MAAALRERGHAVVVPSLAGAFSGSPPYLPTMTAAVTEAVDGADADIVLVGHSGAGGVLPALASGITSTVVGTIFVDALLPYPGLSWFDTAPPELSTQLRALAAPNGLLPRWDAWFPPGAVDELLPDPHARSRFLADIPQIPLAYLQERTPVQPELAPSRCAYLQLSEAYRSEAIQAEHRGWLVVYRAAHHLAMLTDPEPIAASIEEIAATITR